MLIVVLRQLPYQRDLSLRLPPDTRLFAILNKTARLEDKGA